MLLINNRTALEDILIIGDLFLVIHPFSLIMIDGMVNVLFKNREKTIEIFSHN